MCDSISELTQTGGEEIRRNGGYSPWRGNRVLLCGHLPQQSWRVPWRCQERLASPALCQHHTPPVGWEASLGWVTRQVCLGLIQQCMTAKVSQSQGTGAKRMAPLSSETPFIITGRFSFLYILRLHGEGFEGSRRSKFLEGPEETEASSAAANSYREGWELTRHWVSFSKLTTGF